MTLPDDHPENTYRDEEWLRREYVEKDRSAEDIGEECGVQATTIERYCDRFDLLGEGVVRNCDVCGTAFSTAKGERVRWCCDDCFWTWIESYSGDDLHKHERVLRKLYAEFGLSLDEVSQIVEYDTGLLLKQLKDLNIPIRKEEDAPWEVKEILHEMFYEKDYSAAELAEMWGCGEITIHDYLSRCNRNPDSPTLERESDTGMLNSSPGYYYGPNWQEQRLKVLERDTPADADEPVCQRCGMTDTEHRKENERGLEVHHIKPLREFEEDGKVDYEAANALENLITVCVESHSVWEKCQPLRVQPDFAAD